MTPERRTTRGPEGQVWGDTPVEVWDPPHKYVAGWLSLYNEEFAKEPMSRVSFEIVPSDDPGVMRLIVTHDRLDESPKTAQNVSGDGLDVRALEPQDLPRDGRAAARCLTPAAA